MLNTESLKKYAGDAWETTKQMGCQIGKGVKKYAPIYAKKIKNQIKAPNEKPEITLRRWSGRGVTLFLGTAALSLFVKMKFKAFNFSNSFWNAGLCFGASMFGQSVSESKKEIDSKDTSINGLVSNGMKLLKEESISNNLSWNKFDKMIALPRKVDQWSRQALIACNKWMS